MEGSKKGSPWQLSIGSREMLKVPASRAPFSVTLFTRLVAIDAVFHTYAQKPHAEKPSLDGRSENLRKKERLCLYPLIPAESVEYHSLGYC